MVSDKRYSALVASIYSAAVEPPQWSATLTEIAAASGSSGCVLLRSDRCGNAVADRSAGIDGAGMRAYDEYYSALDPIPAALARLPAGTVIARDDAIAPELLFATEFFNDWVRPSGFTDTVFAMLGRNHGSTSWLTAVGPASAGDWSERAALIESLTPHLRQALETQSRIATLEGQNQDFAASMDSAADGLVIVGRDGVVTRANAAAERMLAAADGLTMRRGHVTAAINRAIHGDPPAGDCLQVRRPSGARPYVVRVIPLASGFSALVVIADPEDEPEPAPDALRRIYGLTRTEVQVALRVLNGTGLKPIAEELSTSLSTVRTHLQHVFDKTDTHRQAELVRLLLGGLSATRAPESHPFG